MRGLVELSVKARARARGGAGAWVAACCEGLASGAWWPHRVVGIDLALAKHVEVFEVFRERQQLRRIGGVGAGGRARVGGPTGADREEELG